MIEISKELLSEVLNITYSFKLEPIKDCNLNTLEWWQDEVYKEQMHSINIYELTYKCKQWAYSKGYKIISGERLQDINALFIIQITDMKYNLVYKEFHKSEIEAIVKASEWVLKEIKR